MKASGAQLRVLLFGRYADGDFGGIERHVQALVQALSGDVNFVNLVAARGEPVGDGAIVRAPTVATFASTPLCPTMPFVARRLHRERAFHLAHLHLPDPMSHLAALALPRDVPIVLTWHSDIIRQKNLLKAYRPLLRRLVVRAKAVLAATPAHFASMPQLAALTRPEQRVVVPFGFDLETLRRPHPMAAQLRAVYGDRIVFALGRHVYYKGFEYLVRAMAGVPGAVLLLGGHGPLTGELKRAAAQSGAGGRVVFTGPIPESDLGAYYQACDVFCLPSVEPSEAFGIVQVEAMSCGKPVICAELKNGVNWVNPDGVTGLTVPPRDERALALALSRLLDDPALRSRLDRKPGHRAPRAPRHAFEAARGSARTRQVLSACRGYRHWHGP